MTAPTTEQRAILERLEVKWADDGFTHLDAARSLAREGRPLAQIKFMMRGRFTDAEIKALLAEADQPVLA